MTYNLYITSEREAILQPIKVYTTTYCPYCTQAKRLLTSKNLEFEAIDLTNDNELRAKLSADNNGYRTVPMIFIGKKFIGGYQELHQLSTSGELDKLVASE